MRGRVVAGAGFCVAVIWLSVAVNPTSAEQDISFLWFKDADTKLEPYGYADRRRRWNNANVSVCWENPESASEHAREIVRTAVAETWEKATRGHLWFEGWAKCTPLSQGVRILIVDEKDRPQVLFIGSALDGRRNGIRFNTTFRNGLTRACAHRVDDCIRTIAIHEFGHVLGLLHESKRPDTPQACKASGPATEDNSPDPGEPYAGTYQTPYDDKSIMNYCNGIYEHNATLSDGDKQVAWLIYKDRGY